MLPARVDTRNTPVFLLPRSLKDWIIACLRKKKTHTYKHTNTNSQFRVRSVIKGRSKETGPKKGHRNRLRSKVDNADECFDIGGGVMQ